MLLTCATHWIEVASVRSNPTIMINANNFFVMIQVRLFIEQMSQIFSRAWHRAMTASNVLSGFRATGIFPLNRYTVLCHIEATSDNKNEIEELANKKGLYLPIYSPARPSGAQGFRAVTSDEEDSTHSSEELCDESMVDSDSHISEDDCIMEQEEPSVLGSLLTLPERPKRDLNVLYEARLLEDKMRITKAKEREKAEKEELKKQKQEETVRKQQKRAKKRQKLQLRKREI